MGCGSSNPGSAVGGRAGTARIKVDDATAATPPAPAPPAGGGPGAILAPPAGPEWLRGVAAREQQQAVWARDEAAHWEAARAAAVAAGPVLLNGTDPASLEPDELSALMCGRLDLPSLQRLHLAARSGRLLLVHGASRGVSRLPITDRCPVNSHNG